MWEKLRSVHHPLVHSEPREDSLPLTDNDANVSACQMTVTPEAYTPSIAGAEWLSRGWIRHTRVRQYPLIDTVLDGCRISIVLLAKAIKRQ